MRKFLSDVLIDCNLTVRGSSSLGAATGVTVDTSDNSTNLATTAWVKGLGYVSTDTTYLLSVPANTTNITLQGSNSINDEITLSAAGASSVSRVSASELRISSTDSIDYISAVSFASNTITFTGTGNAFSGTIDLSVYLTQAEGDSRYLQSYSETDTLDTVTSRDGVTTNTIGVGTINVIGTTAGQELLTVDGTFGRLFTVTDDLSESLFSVNTVAGLPALEVFADNSIKLGAFASPITIDSDSNINIPGVITASGYNDANWNTAYNDRIVSAAVSGTSTKTLTLTQGDGGTVTTSWTDLEGDQADGYVSTVALNGNSLDFTGTGSGFTGSIDLSGITTDLTNVETVYSTVRNVSGGLIQKGTPLAVVPGQTSGNISDVVPAAADDPERMPAVFIANEDIANELEGQVVLFGEITGIDTSAFDSGTTVYVAPGGGWTATKPTGANLIQNLGIITKSHNTNGGGVVMGAGRSNDVPNIANGYAWVGNAQGVATPTQLGSNAFTSYTDHSTQGYLTSVAFGDLTSTPTTIGGYGITDAFDGAYSSLSGIPSTFTPSAHNQAWSTITGTPTTISGYGITDAFDGAYSSLSGVPTLDNYVSWNLKTNGVQRTTVASGGTLDIVAGTNVSVSYGAGGVVTINSTDTNTDTNNYLTGLTFNTTNGVLTATRQGLADLTVDLDGRYLTSYTESDPVFTASPAGGIQAEMIDQWNEAYNYSTVGHLPLSGGTLTGTLTLTAVNPRIEFNGTSDASVDMAIVATPEGLDFIEPEQANRIQFQILDDAGVNSPFGYSWNGQSLDLRYASAAQGTKADTAFSWGDHASVGYLTTETRTELSIAGNILSYRDETGAVTEVDLSLYLDDTNLARLVTGTLDNGTGIATFTRSDDTTFDVDFSALFDDTNTYADSLAFSTTTGVLTVGRSGSLADLTVDLDGRYLTSYTETDPIFTASAANSITAGQITNWDTAYDWGDHGAVGYLTSYSETDTLQSVTSRGASTTSSLSVGGINMNSSGQYITFYGNSNAYHGIGAADINGTGSDDLRINSYHNIYVNLDSNSNNTSETTEFVIGQHGAVTTTISDIFFRVKADGEVNIPGYVKLSDGAIIDSGAADGAGAGTVIESFSANVNIGAFLDFTIYNDGKDSMRSGTLQLVFNLDQVMFNEVNTMDIGDTTPCTLTAVNNAGTIDVIFTTPDPTFHIKYHVRTL